MQNNIYTNWSKFGILILIFFLWGFVAASLGVIIPFCKIYFKLDQVESQALGTSFYGAYFIGSYLLFLVSYIIKKEFLITFGYKQSLILGLFLSSIGSFLLYLFCSNPYIKYEYILLGFFIIGLGFSLQQIIANHLVLLLGSSQNASSRLSLAGGVNSFGTLIGPLIVSYLLFQLQSTTNQNWSIDNIRILFIFLVVLFIFSATLLSFLELPKIINVVINERPYKALIILNIIGFFFLLILFSPYLSIVTPISKLNYSLLCFFVLIFCIIYILKSIKKNIIGWGAMGYPNLVYGMFAIFIYVGFEVTIDNNLGAILKIKEFGNYQENQISNFISLYWGSLMIGRWTGSITVFNIKNKVRILLSIIIPILAFILILCIFYIKSYNIQDYYYYLYFILPFILIYILPIFNVAKLLMAVSILASLFLIFAIFIPFSLNYYFIIAVGLCCSIMWPCIFTIALRNLGNLSEQGSSFLIMMILGGAVIPVLQGGVIDLDLNTSFTILNKSYTQWSLLVPLFCSLFLFWYSVKSLKFN